MKKLLTLFFIAMPLMAWAWGSAENEYRVTFVDGTIAEPIYTKSFSSNWTENGGFWHFCFNQPDWLYKNLETIKKCGVEKYLCYYMEKTHMWYDGFVCFKDVNKIEQIK